MGKKRKARQEDASELQDLSNIPGAANVRRDPIRERGCTDVFCCIVFVIFVIGFLAIGCFAFYHGKPHRLLHPLDSNNDMCGQGKYKDKPYLYFFNVLTCVLSGPGVFVKGCDTTQVCVAKCPSSFRAMRRPAPFKSLCEEPYCMKGKKYTDCDDRIANEECPPFLMATAPIFSRCVPLADKLIGDDSRNLLDKNGKNVTRDGSDRKFNLAEKVMKQFVHLKALTDKAVKDVLLTWPYILAGYVMACIVSLAWIVLMRWIAKPMVYISMALFIGLFAIGAIYSFVRYAKIESDEEANYYLDLKVMPLSFSKKKFWLCFGIVFLVIFLIVVCIFIFIRKRVQLAVQLIVEASRAVGQIVSTLIWPIVPFFIQTCVLIAWLSISVYLLSFGRGQKDTNSTMNSDEKSGNFLSMFECTSNETLGKVCGFIKYGTRTYVFYLLLYSLFMFFWLFNFFIALGDMTLAGTFASYYWAFEKPRDIPSCPLCASFKRAIRYHLGTLALGSLFIAIVKIIRTILEYIEEKLKDSENPVGQFCAKCWSCCFWCIEAVLQYLTKNAYIMTAMYGYNFCTSAKKAASLLASNLIRVVVLDKITDFLLFIGKLTVVGLLTYAAYIFFHRGYIGEIVPDMPELNFYALPVALIFIGTYLIATCFFNVYHMAVDTIFLCVLLDLDENDGSPSRPYFMSTNLMKILHKSNYPPKLRA